MPVCAVGGGRDGDGAGGLDERAGACAVVEGDGVGAEVDAVRDVVPHHRVERRGPLALATNIPPQSRIASSSCSADQPIFHLGEMAFEEVDLVLQRCARCVGAGAHHAKVVVDEALVDAGGRLRDQLGAPHVLSVPVGGVVDGHFDALFRGRVGRVFVVGGKIDVFGYGPGAVNVVLIGGYLVGPGPYAHESEFVERASMVSGSYSC